MMRPTRRIGLAVRATLALGLAMSLSGRAEAQYMDFGYLTPPYANYGYMQAPYVGGFGWGGWGSGYGAGYTGLGGLGYGPGMTIYDQALLKEQMYALNAGRYNLMNAEADKAYAAANYFQQRAIDDEVNRYRRAKSAAADGGKGGSPGMDGTAAAPARLLGYRGRPPRPIPADRLFAADGQVLWPLATPKGDDLDSARKEADRDIAAVVEARRKNGYAPVRDVLAAREKLAKFARPAYEQLKEADEREAAGFEHFVLSLDYALRTMAYEPEQAARPATRTEVESPAAPKTGADVLKKEVEKD